MRIRDYPKLQQWYDQQDGSTCNGDLLHSLVTAVYQSLHQYSDHNFIASLQQILLQITNLPDDQATDFLADLHEFLQEMALDFFSLLTEAAELSLHTHQARDFAHTCQRAADSTSFVALRFISAWLALNLSDYQNCVNECDKVEQPFAQIYTIHGQALLENLEPVGAIEVLLAAVKLDPKEILAWFQLAKAYDVTGQHQLAWDALCQCQKIMPTNQEIAVFMAMVALKRAQEGEPQTLNVAWACMWPHHTALAGNLTYVSLMSDLALQLNTPERLNSLWDVCHWDSLGSQGEFMELLPRLLREMHHRSWHYQAQRLLEALT